MRSLLISSLLLCSSAYAVVSPAGPEETALKFNHWYVEQLIKENNPLMDYTGLSLYVTSSTINALKIANAADPNIEDVPDSDMFIKAQDYSADWQQIEIVSSDYDPVCRHVYVSFGANKAHTVIDCMVKEDGVWKVQSVAGQKILPNISLK